MTEKDLLIAPIYLLLIITLAYFGRPWFTDKATRPYFLPALLIKLVGAIAVGLVYQFYYGGGDTFIYHTHGSVHIWNAFMDNPMVGLKMIFGENNYTGGVWSYATKIWYYRDDASFFIVRIAAIFDIFTLGTYSSTALLFAVLSFSGVWALFKVFYEKYPEYVKYLAISILFIPTVFFWGSGILKDSVTLGMLGWIVFSFHKILLSDKNKFRYVFLIVPAVVSIFIIKKYILLSLLPAIILWVYANYVSRINNKVIKLAIAPVFIVIALGLGYYTVLKVGEDDPRYKLEKLAKTARTTAYDIRYGWGKDAGSGYSLGELDGTFGSMVRLMPQAVNVSLFRPYLWEVNNSLMLLSAIESFIFLVLTGWIMVNLIRKGSWKVLFNPDVVFTLIFSISFAFAV
ncbi:MAG: hypothetical protein OEY34_06820, partial [Cyclobacteriaceae bacterium]|nr:hypothetical protein [Cyclobacteriaceae bacterium]